MSQGSSLSLTGLCISYHIDFTGLCRKFTVWHGVSYRDSNGVAIPSLNEDRKAPSRVREASHFDPINMIDGEGNEQIIIFYQAVLDERNHYTTFSLKGELGWRKIAMSAYVADTTEDFRLQVADEK